MQLPQPFKIVIGEYNPTERLALVYNLKTILRQKKLTLDVHFEITSFDNGDKLVEHVKIVGADLVIINGTLVGKNGIEAVKEIRAHQPDATKLLIWGMTNGIYTAVLTELVSNNTIQGIEDKSKVTHTADKIRVLINARLTKPGTEINGAPAKVKVMVLHNEPAITTMLEAHLRNHNIELILPNHPGKIPELLAKHPEIKLFATNGRSGGAQYFPAVREALPNATLVFMSVEDIDPRHRPLGIRWITGGDVLTLAGIAALVAKRAGTGTNQNSERKPE